MSYLEALDIVVARTNVERYRWLCSEENPDVELRQGYRRLMVAMAEAPPPLPQQAASLARSLWEWAVSGFAMASEELQARRLEICRACPQWDAGRCRVCGCNLRAKVKARSGRCPIDQW